MIRENFLFILNYKKWHWKLQKSQRHFFFPYRQMKEKNPTGEIKVFNIAFRKLLSVYVFRYFPFGFEGRILDLIVSVPDHCLSFYFTINVMDYFIYKEDKFYHKTVNLFFHDLSCGVFPPSKIKEIIPIGIFQNPTGFFFCKIFENSHRNINIGWILLHHGKIYFNQIM